MYKKINSCNKSKAFSLVEILIAILIVSILTAVLAPSITKKLIKKKNEGIVYTYRYDNKVTADNICFRLGSSGNTDTSNTDYYSTRDCSKYTFTVPDDVFYINLTMQAGGGGGGGAGGGSVTEKALHSSDSGTTTTKTIAAYLLRSLTIDVLTGPGQKGKSTCYYMTTNSSNNCGGAGGASSPAIVNFDLPRSIMRTTNYTNKTLGSTPLITLNLLRDSDQAYTRISNGTNTLTYRISRASSDAVPTAQCEVGTTTYPAGNTGFTNICKVGSTNYITSIQGRTTGSCGNSGGGSTNLSLTGGYGGNALGEYAGGYGAGGQGDSCDIRYCSRGSDTSCAIIGCVDSTTSSSLCAKISGTTTINDTGYVRQYRPAQEGGPAHAGITYKLEYPGVAGGGGAAGTFLRVLAFPVTPGDTYTVYVGAGGTGGAGGASSASPTAGTAGKGGVTTAIFDSDGTLVFMVNGGAGGTGGSYGSGSYSTNLSRNTATSGRNFAKVFYSHNYINNLYLDNALISITTQQDSHRPAIAETVNNLTYTALDDGPYSTMSANGFNDNKYGGYSNYNSSFNPANGAYDGLMKQAVFGNDFVYVGGLGGFNGLGGKAGCGGYFYGNYDGRTNAAGTAISNSKIGTFTPNAATYNVNEYYDNCSTLTPNGQTADFVPPDPAAGTFGQAGAGGGGGGYGIADGAGNGGAGQDGYLMIDWSR